MPKTRERWPEQLGSYFKLGTKAFIQQNLTSEKADNLSEWIRNVVEKRIREIKTEKITGSENR